MNVPQKWNSGGKNKMTTVKLPNRPSFPTILVIESTSLNLNKTQPIHATIKPITLIK